MVLFHKMLKLLFMIVFMNHLLIKSVHTLCSQKYEMLKMNLQVLSYCNLKVDSMFRFASFTCLYRSLWKKCCFSGDGEYIVAGSARQHSLYIWEKGSGNLVKFLLGKKGEMLLDVVVSRVSLLLRSLYCI